MKDYDAILKKKNQNIELFLSFSLYHVLSCDAKT